MGFCLYMNTPMHLVAQNVHGPCFATPVESGAFDGMPVQMLTILPSHKNVPKKLGMQNLTFSKHIIEFVYTKTYSKNYTLVSLMKFIHELLNELTFFENRRHRT